MRIGVLSCVPPIGRLFQRSAHSSSPSAVACPSHRPSIVALISGVLLTFGHGALAQNVIQVTCDGNFSPIQTLCKNGNNCNNLGGLINPGPASNSGQDNVEFVTVPAGQVVNVTWEVEQIDITSSQGVQSDDAIVLDFSGPATSPATPQTIDDDTPFPPPFAHTYTQNGVSTPPPVQISIGPTAGPGSQHTFQVAQYRVKCTPAKGTLTINKISIGGDDTFAVVATPSAGSPVNYSIPTTSGSGSQSQDVAPDTYTISETPPAGWILDSIQCGNGPAGQTATAVVTANATTTCTVTNRKKASVTIKKETINGTGSFSFVSSTTPAGQAAIGPFSQDTTAANPSTGQTLTDLVPGSYTFTETPPAGTWLLTDLVCDTGTGISAVSHTGLQGSFTLAPGASGTCTFKNTLQQANKGTIIINKVAVGGDALFPFTATGAGLPASFNIQTVAGAGGQTFANLDPGPYSVTEDLPNLPTGWTLTNLTCSAGGSPSGATANITIQGGDTVTCTFTNTKTQQQQTTLTLLKEVTNTNGGTAVDTDFTLTFTGPSNGSGIEGQAPITNANVTPGAYTLTETGPAAYDLTAITCTGGADANGLDGLTLTAGENVTCTFFNNDKKDDDPKDETKRFIHRRVDNLLSHDPDRARMLRRLGEQEKPVSLKDGPLKFSGERSTAYQVGSGGGMMGFGSPMGPGGTANTGTGDDDRLPWVRGPFDSDYENTFGDETTQGSNTNLLFASFANQLAPLVNGATSFKFGTSLSELRSKAAEAEARAQQKKLQEAGISFAGQPYLDPTTTLRQGLDVWVEGHISRYSDDLGGINRDGDFRILYVGADYVLAPHILVGALVQIDDTNEDLDDPTQTGEIDGTGWMVGPYAGVKLLDNLFLDARAAWGQSDNDIWLNDPVFGFRSGSFDTERWLATATLTGVHYHGAWRFSPQVGLAYGHESFDTYTTSIGQTVVGDDANIGRLTGGVEVGYRLQARYGMIVEPHIALNGIWNFDSDDLVINGVLTETEETRAEIEGGVMVTTASGWAFRAAGRYDGIGGDDFEAYGGSLWVNVPLH